MYAVNWCPPPQQNFACSITSRATPDASSLAITCSIPSGATRPMSRRARSMSTSAASAKRSSPIPKILAISKPFAAPAIVSSLRSSEGPVKNRIFFKLLAAFLVVIAAAAFIFDVTLRNAWQDSLRSEIERNLEQKTLMFAHRVEAGGPRPLADIAAQEAQAAGARATIIDASGKVLADSQADLANAD